MHVMWPKKSVDVFAQPDVLAENQRWEIHQRIAAFRWPDVGGCQGEKSARNVPVDSEHRPRSSGTY
jgi:hypothetical protein